MNILSTYLVYFYMMLAAGNENTYQKAETLASLAISSTHEDRDTLIFCDGKMTAIILKDSIINKPGGVGTEYNYPIYMLETEITYYNNNKIASIEKKEIHLKRSKYSGVTSGIQKTTIIDSTQTFYFDQEQNLITQKQLLKIKEKVCKDKGN